MFWFLNAAKDGNKIEGVNTEGGGETVKVYGQIPKWEASISLGVARIIDRAGLGYSLTDMRERQQFLTKSKLYMLFNVFWEYFLFLVWKSVLMWYKGGNCFCALNCLLMYLSWEQKTRNLTNIPRAWIPTIGLELEV